MKTRLISLGILIYLLSGCYPNGAEYVDELDLTIAIKDNQTDYTKHTAYRLADTVVVISEKDGEALKESQQTYILNAIKMRFNEYGWMEAGVNDSTAVIVTPTVLKNVNLVVTNDWWYYWGGWGGWGYYPPGGYYPWYPGYPGYCCYTSVYSYTTGSLILEMLDPNLIVDNNDPEPQPIPSIWMGGINGLIQGSDASINARIDRGLDQVFKDSPYLKK